MSKWVVYESMWSESGGTEERYYVFDDKEDADNFANCDRKYDSDIEVIEHTDDELREILTVNEYQSAFPNSKLILIEEIELELLRNAVKYYKKFVDECDFQKEFTPTDLTAAQQISVLNELMPKLYEKTWEEDD